ncbi:hypothetical protein [Fusobacterium mortiferum]|uniref:Uncharacterized protein n=1 Tax=Fusobacterium mortiferum TaxID=850 RepID=A0ABS2G4P7_FUSMR|nr:hypothetical protein [Fusobacterium mortiferum]MBM6876406.1 hypothetical protein [Fusobacterium mortiferum]
MITLGFENEQPFLDAEIEGRKERNFFTVEQAEQTARILLEWVANTNKKTMIVIAGEKNFKECNE